MSRSIAPAIVATFTADTAVELQYILARMRFCRSASSARSVRSEKDRVWGVGDRGSGFGDQESGIGYGVAGFKFRVGSFGEEFGSSSGGSIQSKAVAWLPQAA